MDRKSLSISRNEVKFSTTILSRAVRNGYFDIVKSIVENGGDPNVKDANGLTALVHASEQNNREMLKFLVENGADINVENYYISLVMKSSKNKIVTFSGTDPNGEDNNDYMNLIKASRKGYINIMELLSKNTKIENNGVKNDDDMVITLGYASELENFELLKFLVEKTLMEASKNERFKIIKFLVENGADDPQCWSQKQYNAFMEVSKNKNCPIAAYLLASGIEAPQN